MMKRTVIALSAAMILSACGGGGGGGSNPTPAAGIAGYYEGTNSVGDDLAGLVLADGNFWFVQADGSNIVGVAQGKLSLAGASISSSNVKDYSFADDDVYSATLSGTAVAGTSLSGTVTYGPGESGTVTLTYEDDTVPAANSAAGTWGGVALGTFGDSADLALTINATGAITGTDDECAFTGQLSPVKGGYTLRVTYANSDDCYWKGATQNGVALLVGGELVGMLTNAARTEGALFRVSPP